MIRTIVLASILSIAGSAHAQDLPRGVLVALEPCAVSDLDLTLVLEGVRVELTTDGVDHVTLAGTSAIEEGRPLAIITIAQVACAERSSSFMIRVEDRITRKRVERGVELGEIPVGSRPRALAIAAAELLRASWAELAIIDPEPSVPAQILDATALRVRIRGLREARALGDPAEIAPDAPRAREPRPTVTVAALVRSFPGGRASGIGARAGLDLFPSPELVIRVDAEAVAGTSLDRLGTIDLGLATAGLTAAYIAWVGDVMLTIGARLGVGAAWASGHAFESSAIGRAGAGPVVTITAALELDVPVSEWLGLRFGVDVGAVPLAFEARVGGVPVAGISGASLGGWGGIALRP